MDLSPDVVLVLDPLVWSERIARKQGAFIGQPESHERLAIALRVGSVQVDAVVKERRHSLPTYPVEWVREV